MKTGFSLLEILHRENPVFITGMGLQCWLFKFTYPTMPNKEEAGKFYDKTGYPAIKTEFSLFQDNPALITGFPYSQDFPICSRLYLLGNTVYFILN